MAAGSAKLCVRSTQDDSQAQHDAINGAQTMGQKSRFSHYLAESLYPAALPGRITPAVAKLKSLAKWLSLLLLCHKHGTSGSLTYRCLVDIFASYSATHRTPPKGERASKKGFFGETLMKIVYVCYAALGYAVARWIFQRQPLPIVDPVTRFRSSGLL